MMDALKLTQEQVAKRLGKARSAVANFLRLLNLPDEVKDLLNAGELSMGKPGRCLVCVTSVVLCRWPSALSQKA